MGKATTHLSATLLRRTLIWYPAAALTCFSVYVIRARVSLGRWPEYNNPDPKRLRFETHYDLTANMLILMLLTGIVVLLASVAALIFPLRRSWRRNLWPGLLSFIAAIAAMATDPGGFVSWFGD